jgi:hypothetical protein
LLADADATMPTRIPRLRLAKLSEASDRTMAWLQEDLLVFQQPTAWRMTRCARP